MIIDSKTRLLAKVGIWQLLIQVMGDDTIGLQIYDTMHKVAYNGSVNVSEGIEEAKFQVTQAFAQHIQRDPDEVRKELVWTDIS